MKRRVGGAAGLIERRNEGCAGWWARVVPVRGVGVPLRRKRSTVRSLKIWGRVARDGGAERVSPARRKTRKARIGPRRRRGLVVVGIIRDAVAFVSGWWRTISRGRCSVVARWWWRSVAAIVPGVARIAVGLRRRASRIAVVVAVPVIGDVARKRRWQVAARRSTVAVEGNVASVVGSNGRREGRRNSVGAVGHYGSASAVAAACTTSECRKEATLVRESRKKSGSDAPSCFDLFCRRRAVDVHWLARVRGAVAARRIARGGFALLCFVDKDCHQHSALDATRQPRRTMNRFGRRLASMREFDLDLRSEKVTWACWSGECQLLVRSYHGRSDEAAQTYLRGIWRQLQQQQQHPCIPVKSECYKGRR